MSPPSKYLAKQPKELSPDIIFDSDPESAYRKIEQTSEWLVPSTGLAGNVKELSDDTISSSDVDVGSQIPRQSSDDLITFPAQESREFLAETIPGPSAKPRIQKPMDVIDLTAVEPEVSRGNPIDMSANSAFNGEAKNKIVEVGPDLPIPTIEGEAL